MKKKREHKRKCPCGSGEFFDSCCSIQSEGTTPDEIKKAVTECVIQTFNTIGEIRGETCLYVASLTRDLLRLFNVRSYVAAGSSSWKNSPVYYSWKSNDGVIVEYHAWVVTEYGELVDLACDDIVNRRDAYKFRALRLGLAPSTCWDKNPQDREYIVRDLGAKSLALDKRGYAFLWETACVSHFESAEYRGHCLYTVSCIKIRALYGEVGVIGWAARANPCGVALRPEITPIEAPCKARIFIPQGKYSLAATLCTFQLRNTRRLAL